MTTEKGKVFDINKIMIVLGEIESKLPASIVKQLNENVKNNNYKTVVVSSLSDDNEEEQTIDANKEPKQSVVYESAADVPMSPGFISENSSGILTPLGNGFRPSYEMSKKNTDFPVQTSHHFAHPTSCITSPEILTPGSVSSFDSYIPLTPEIVSSVDRHTSPAPESPLEIEDDFLKVLLSETSSTSEIGLNFRSQTLNGDHGLSEAQSSGINSEDVSEEDAFIPGCNLQTSDNVDVGVDILTDDIFSMKNLTLVENSPIETVGFDLSILEFFESPNYYSSTNVGQLDFGDDDSFGLGSHGKVLTSL